MAYIDFRHILLSFTTALLLAPFAVLAQEQESELYHIHVVKAAPGKLPQLISEYKNEPGPQEGQPQASPVILRHREGSEWDLIEITPLGKETTISAQPPSKAVQEYRERLWGLAAWHGDTFAVGPAWATVQKVLVPEGNAQQAVYVVSDYRALSGHRRQLREVLDGNAEQTPGRAVIFSHVEGAPWNLLMVTRYDSWADLGADTQPQAGQQEPGLAIREHLAVHHDTICTYVSGGEAIR